VQTCAPNPAPRALRDDEHITQRPSETVNPKDVSAKDTIDQPTPTEQQLLHALGDDTDGLDPSANENGSNAESQGNSTGDNTAENDPARNLGKPASPEPGESASSPAAGGSGAGAGGGGAPPSTPELPEPPPDAGGPGPGGGGGSEVTPAPRFIVGSDGTIAVNDAISPANVLGPGESVPTSLNIGGPGEDGVYNISPAESSSGSLDLPSQAGEADRFNNPDLLTRPDASQYNAYADEPLDYSHIKDTTDAIDRAQQGFGRGASKTSAWVRLVNELVNFIHNYPRW
jgi:hypothetical protein